MDDPNEVIAALSAVMGELPAIAKDQKSADAQGNYKYRGIEQIIAHLQPLLVKHGLVFVPEVLSRESVPVTVSNTKVWSDTFLTVRYRVYHRSGQMIEVGPIVGIGRDGADKGANKCMSQALKYALLQVFMIGDRADDADGTTVEAEAPSRSVPSTLDTLRGDLYSRFEALGKAEQKEYMEHSRIVEAPWIAQMTEEQIKEASAWLDEMMEEPF